VSCPAIQPEYHGIGKNLQFPAKKDGAGGGKYQKANDYSGRDIHTPSMRLEWAIFQRPALPQ
jgi:hypothetical protein